MKFTNIFKWFKKEESNSKALQPANLISNYNIASFPSQFGGKYYDYVQRNYYELYKQYIGLQKSAIEFRAENLAQAEIKVYHINIQGEVKPAEVSEDAYRILKLYNPEFSKFEMLELVGMNLDIVGNAYWKIVRNQFGVVQEFWPLSTIYNSTMKPIIENSEIVGYSYTDYLYGKEILYDKKDVIHFRNVNPTNPYIGLGKIAGNPYVFEMETMLNQYQNSFIQNNGLQNAYIKLLSDTNETNAKQFIESFQKDFAGVVNAGKMPVLKEAEIVSLQSTPKELDWVKTQSIIQDKILSTLRVHPALLGLIKDVNRANGITALEQFYNLHLKPTGKRVADKLTHFIRQELEDDSLLVSLEFKPPEDQELEIKKKTLQLNGGVLLRNELRNISNDLDILKDRNGNEDPRGWDLATPVRESKSENQEIEDGKIEE